MIRSSGFCHRPGAITRREFGARTGLGFAGFALSLGRGSAWEEEPSPVALARNPDRSASLKTAFQLLGRIDFGGRDLYLKGNFNSPDPFPATTHPDTLNAVVSFLRTCNCGKLTLVERSGMGITSDVWARLGLPDLARRLDVTLMALEDLPDNEWQKEELPGSNWKTGVEVPRFLNRDAFLVQICNLKTHRFGGVFSASLKNSIGLVAKYGRIKPGYNYMKELHASPQQGAMIAEVNQIYAPRLVIMDATQVFTSGGPETGELASPEAVLASSDRVAIDAAGVALLQLSTTGDPQKWRSVFEQDQLKRAIELKLGAPNAEAIRFVTADVRASRLALQLEAILQETPKKPG